MPDPIPDPSPVRAMARDHYQSANCSALMGVHLFRDGGLVESSAAPGEPLSLCTGGRVWVDCPQGLPDVLSALENSLSQARDEGRYGGSEMPDDWGVVANTFGEITHRSSHNGVLRRVAYLGHISGHLAVKPATIDEVGIGPRTPPARERG